jgi:hypothetical protein
MGVPPPKRTAEGFATYAGMVSHIPVKTINKTLSLITPHTPYQLKQNYIFG